MAGFTEKVFRISVLLGAAIGLTNQAVAFAPDLGRVKHAGAAMSLRHSIAVFGKDDRRSVPNKYARLKRQIGLLYNGETNTLCSAFCVAPDVIATAAHCLFNRVKGKPLNFTDFVFRLDIGRNRITHERIAGAASTAARHNVIAGTTGLSRRPPIGAAKDWALAKLAGPACRYGHIRVRPRPLNSLIASARQKRIYQLAYHLDVKNWQLAYNRGCRIRRDFKNVRWQKIRKQFANANALVLHQCDTGGASSGSPLLMDTPDGPVAVAINVGTYQQRNLTLRNGRVVRRSRFKTIANTAVNATQFAALIEKLHNANVIESEQDLKVLQAYLKEKGLYRGNIDGLYGRKTEHAIKSMERKLNMPVTGIPTQDLLGALGNLTSNTSASPSPAQQPKQ